MATQDPKPSLGHQQVWGWAKETLNQVCHFVLHLDRKACPLAVASRVNSKGSICCQSLRLGGGNENSHARCLCGEAAPPSPGFPDTRSSSDPSNQSESVSMITINLYNQGQKCTAHIINIHVAMSVGWYVVFRALVDNYFRCFSVFFHIFTLKLQCSFLQLR